jgi:hypothetical protein
MFRQIAMPIILNRTNHIKRGMTSNVNGPKFVRINDVIMNISHITSVQCDHSILSPLKCKITFVDGARVTTGLSLPVIHALLERELKTKIPTIQYTSPMEQSSKAAAAAALECKLIEARLEFFL